MLGGISEKENSQKNGGKREFKEQKPGQTPKAEEISRKCTL